MKLKSIAIVMIGLLASLSLTAVAAGDDYDKEAELTPEQEELFTTLDTAGDGVISEEEAQAHPELAARFHELDRAGDGQLDKAEFAAFEIHEEEMPEEAEAEEEERW